MPTISALRGKRAATLAAAACLSFSFIQCSDSPTGGNSSAGAVFQPAFSSTPAQVREFIAKGQGGTHAKLVYVDQTSADGKLCYIDFSEAGAVPVIHVIAAAKQPAVPVISPDGNWVVYASGAGPEAGSPLTARSSIFLSKLSETATPMLLAADSACEPRFVQNAPAGTLSVIYATLDPDLAWQGHGQTRRIDLNVAGANPIPAAPTVLWPGGGYSAGLSWDNRYLSAGGAHVARLDLMGTKGQPDTLSYQLIQSCNASASSSRIFTNKIMYLNTGSAYPKFNGGKEWGEWQAILIGDTAQSLVKGYIYPATYANPLETEPKSYTGVKWHHPEWSNHPYFATATLNVNRYFKSGASFANTEYQERIYLLNLQDSSYLEVLRPDKVTFTGKGFANGFYWPWLWVEVPAGFQESTTWLKPD